MTLTTRSSCEGQHRIAFVACVSTEACMFNAKPDLAIVLPNCVIVVEAKLTMAFDAAQLRRTRKLAEVWARLLHRDLGFETPPPFAIARLGYVAADVDISWQ